MENKIKYNFGGLRKIGDVSVGYIEGWTFEPKDRELLNLRKVNVKGEEKSVATLTISSTLAKSMMKYNFGEEFEKEQHFIECTAWGTVAERLAKFNPTPKMILGIVGEVKVQEYDKKDGNKGKKLVMTIDTFKGVTKKQEGYSSSTPVDEPEFQITDMEIPF